MANPILPGISEAEQELLYKKLNEYNQGRTSYKRQVLIWLYCPVRNLPATPYGCILLFPNASPFFTSRTFLQTFMKVCERQAAYVIILHVAFCW